MPYTLSDRKNFIDRCGITHNMKVLDFGGLLYEELPFAISGITTKKNHLNAVIIRPQLLPFKDSVFDAIVSYHYPDLISKDDLGFAFEEVARVLTKGSNFSFMITLWAPQNESQRGNLFFNEILIQTGSIFQHGFEEVSQLLSESGFNEITVESIKREITIPPEFTQEHLLMLGNLVKKERAMGETGIKAIAKQYYHQIKNHGEAMMPALHFTARK